MKDLKFLIDENVGQSIAEYLIQQGYDVLMAGETLSGREDLQLFEVAYQQNRIIVTNDKGFGFLVFRQAKPAKGIILFRFSTESPALKIAALEKVLQQSRDKVLSRFVVITEAGFRIRGLEKVANDS